MFESMSLRGVCIVLSLSLPLHSEAGSRTLDEGLNQSPTPQALVAAHLCATSDITALTNRVSAVNFTLKNTF